MKELKTLLALLLCIALLCGCGGDQDSTTPSESGSSGNIVYSVTVTGADGVPVGTDVIVHFLSNGNTVAMQAVNDQGIAEKVLPAGEYAVELTFVDASASFHYDDSDLTLTKDKTSVSIVLSNAITGSMKIHANSSVTGDYKEYDASLIGIGSTYITLDNTDRTFVLFTPQQAGLYRFSVNDSDADIGYYGSPYMVQQWNLAETEADGSFTVSITEGMIGTNGTGTTILVLGIDAKNAKSCYISIERIGDPVLSIEDYEWTVYETTAMLEKFKLPNNVTLHEFDLTAKPEDYDLILSDQDGYYHLNSADGPVVYFKLGMDSEYLDSIQTILDTSAICRYFFDENGEFLYKESYTECLLEYIGFMDEESGLYPLTNDLMYIIQQRGAYVGWWDTGSGIYLFVDSNGNPIPGINPEIAWLFNCCYGEIDPEAGKEEPTEPEETKPTESDTEQEKTVGKESAAEEVVTALVESFTATVNGGEYAKYSMYRVMTTIYLTIESKDAYVIYNDRVYWPENGVVTVVLEGTPLKNNFSFAIGNSGSETAAFTVRMGNPKGAQSNPYDLVFGNNTVKLESGNETGTYFTSTATETGNITVSIASVSGNAVCQIVINVTTGDIPLQYVLADADSITISVNAGDKLELIVSCADMDNPNKHPAATVAFTVKYE